jgi:hypothetical protein
MPKTFDDSAEMNRMVQDEMRRARDYNPPRPMVSPGMELLERLERTVGELRREVAELKGMVATLLKREGAA